MLLDNTQLGRVAGQVLEGWNYGCLDCVRNGGCGHVHPLGFATINAFLLGKVVVFRNGPDIPQFLILVDLLAKSRGNQRDM